RWIDELFEASGLSQKDEFVWNELIKPLVELHSLLAIKNGLPTELHQQNLSVVIDRVTKRVKGLMVRDMDGHTVDHSLRVHQLGKSVLGEGDFRTSASLFRYAHAQNNQMVSYLEKLRMESIQWIFKYVLPHGALNGVLQKADRFI